MQVLVYSNCAARIVSNTSAYIYTKIPMMLMKSHWLLSEYGYVFTTLSFVNLFLETCYPKYVDEYLYCYVNLYNTRWCHAAKLIPQFIHSSIFR